MIDFHSENFVVTAASQGRYQPYYSLRELLERQREVVRGSFYLMHQVRLRRR
jgi:hypothetical protein